MISSVYTCQRSNNFLLSEYQRLESYLLIVSPDNIQVYQVGIDETIIDC